MMWEGKGGKSSWPVIKKRREGHGWGVQGERGPETSVAGWGRQTVEKKRGKGRGA